jgi:hypothetical protein
MMRHLWTVGLYLSLLASPCLAADEGWISLFDGKSLDGWKASENPEAWSVKDGTIVGDGKRSHLFWMVRECDNCEFKAMVKISDGGNSGMYFRTVFMSGFPDGYEVQVNSSAVDPQRTGSFFSFVKVFDQLVPPDTWFEQHVIADGNHVIVKVNGKVTVDTIEKKNKYSKGYFALQQHNQGSVVWFKDLMMRPIPAKK